MLKDIKVPMLAESVSEATLVNWHIKPGDKVKRGENLIDIETDKVTLEITAPDNGVIQELLMENGADVKSDDVIARIELQTDSSTTDAVIESTPDSDREPEQQSLPVLNQSQVVNDEPDNESDLKLSPAVRSMVQNYDLNLSNIDHKKENRISKSDVIEHLDHTHEQTDFNSTLAFHAVDVAPTEPDQQEVVEQSTQESTERDENRVPMNRLRQRIAERLLSAQQENAILTTFNEVNMQPVIDLRERYRQEFEQTHGVKLGFMSFFCKASIEALKKFPVLNASVDGTDIVYHDYFDIGIAVSSEKGLFVPVVRDADIKTLSDIEKEIRVFGEKAGTGSLGIDELTGGTFTITNGGVFGSLLSTPILNPPQSAILGMHKIEQRPIAENNQVVIRPMMYLALSYDHRIIDGREAVQFLVAVKEQLEDPARLLLQI